MDWLIKTKQVLIEEIVFYGDANINEYQFLSQQEIDFDEASQGFIDDNNDIIFEKTKLKKFHLKSRNKKISLLECSIQPNLKLFNKYMILEHWSGEKIANI